MTVAEFIEKLRALPQDAEVVTIYDTGSTFFRASPPFVDNAETDSYMSTTYPVLRVWEEGHSKGEPVKVVVID